MSSAFVGVFQDAGRKQRDQGCSASEYSNGTQETWKLSPTTSLIRLDAAIVLDAPAGLERGM